MGIRQVPSRLEPELRGFLQDLRNEIGRVSGDGFKLVLLGDMRTALNGDFVNYADIARIIGEVQDGVRNDPFFQFLGEKINLIDGPPTLPGSIQARLDTTQDTITTLMAEADAQLQAGIDANGSAIVTLQTVTAGQATQITTLGSRLGTAESKVSMLMSATPTDALWWAGISSDVSGTKSNVAMLMSTSPTGALWWTGLKSQSDTATSNVAMLMSATPTGASWWQQVTTNTSNISNLLSTTPTSAQWWSGLKTTVDNNSSSIVTLQNTTDSQATSISQLNSTVSGNSASIQTLQNTTNGLSAEYSVRLDVNGYVAGFGFYNHGTSSAFYVRASKFAVGDPSSGNRVPFIIQDGTVYIDTAMIKDATIGGAKIADATITNAKIQTAAVTTLSVAGDNITVPRSARFYSWAYGGYAFSYSEFDLFAHVIPAAAAGTRGKIFAWLNCRLVLTNAQIDAITQRWPLAVLEITFWRDGNAIDSRSFRMSNPAGYQDVLGYVSTVDSVDNNAHTYTARAKFYASLQGSNDMYQWPYGPTFLVVCDSLILEAKR